MGIRDAFLPEFDHETANTRKTIERIPADKLDWRPHERSMTFEGLATHLANMPRWAVMTVHEDKFDIAPEGEDPTREEPVGSVEKALGMFDRNVAAARAAIAGSDDERLRAPWSLLSGGTTLFTMPRIAVLRGMIMNHLIHHRGQLTVYLRLNDVPVPALYGPSADEAP
jgi:uncharacterized damage-inducible protein DinB